MFQVWNFTYKPSTWRISISLIAKSSLSYRLCDFRTYIRTYVLGSLTLMANHLFSSQQFLVDHLHSKGAVPPQRWHLLKTPKEAAGNQSLSIALKVQHKTPKFKSKCVALGDVSSGSSSRDPTNSSQELIQASYFGDSALAVHHEFKPQVPPGRSKKRGAWEGHATR